ncbi:MAG: NAD(P)/FAD-dependent oxidoreductase [Flavisolibacter sp.]|nr:NAD(P)/FAD-dependent oxidoreductase [Flavisolibacter sp.]
MKKQLVVIGGGAAGFFCAVNAARMNPNLHVIILEKTNKLLSKVKVSGGGRCNVTHALFDIAEMCKRYPRGQNFVKKTFHQFFTTDTIEWFKARGVRLKAENDGRMFPVTDSSQTIIDGLMNEANSYGIEIRIMSEVRSLIPIAIGTEGGKFHIELSNLRHLTSDFVCIACGGYPKTSMFQWLQSLGHSIAEPVPSLFTFNLPKHPITQLMGVSVGKARVKIEGSKLTEEGPVLITHWGLSGPAVLRLSAWGARELSVKSYEFKVHINWLPDFNEQTLKEQFQNFRISHSTKKIINHNFGFLPNRLWQFLLEQSGINSETRFADLSSKTENIVIKNLVDYVAEVNGKTTFKEEFVTAGGINLSEVDANTMMSKKVPNLFFAGEILDVDGITGGFNFQHAWTSGWIAAKTIASL